MQTTESHHKLKPPEQQLHYSVFMVSLVASNQSINHHVLTTEGFTQQKRLSDLKDSGRLLHCTYIIVLDVS